MVTGMEALELRKDRAKLIQEAGGILKKAKDEKRDLTKAESEAFDKLHERAEGIEGMYLRLEQQEARDAEIAGKRFAARDNGETTDADDLAGDGVVLEKRHSMAAWAKAKGYDEDDSFPGLSVGGMGRAICTGPKTDVERRALAEGSDSTGGVTVPIITSSQFIDKLRAKAVCLRAGAITVPLDTDKTAIARLSGDPTVAWRAENASISPSDPTFQRLQFDAQTLAALVVVSRELFEDSVNIEAMLNNAFAQSFATELDRACLFGSGTPPEPQGIFGASGVGSVTIAGGNGALPTSATAYDGFLDARNAILTANGAEPTAYIISPVLSGLLAKTKDTLNVQLPAPVEVAGKILTTTSVPVNQTVGTASGNCTPIIAGDFTELYVGIRTKLRILVLRERYADLGQIGLLGWMRADVQLAHAASFARYLGNRAS